MEIPPGQKKFECEHCQAEILVPIDLPPTTAPCPVCQEITTSPGLEPVVEKAAPISQDSAPRVAESTVEERRDSSAVIDSRSSGNDRALDHKDYESRGEKKSKGGLLWLLAALAFLGLLLGGLLLLKNSRAEEKPVEPSGGDNKIAEGDAEGQGTSSQAVQENSSEQVDVLTGFLNATSPEERAKYVIGKESVIEEMKRFYRKRGVEKEKLRAQFFSQIPSDPADASRGISLFQFERPKQFDIGSFFSPIVDMRTQNRLIRPSLNVRSALVISNFEMEAEKAMVFFKKTDGEYLLDWHTYVQTRYRTLRDFVNIPKAGAEAVFRVIIGEHASTIYSSDPSIRNYVLYDSAHFSEDLVVITVKKSSEIGALLEKLAWTDIPEKGYNNSGATVLLKWSNDSNPVLSIEKLICWEFLGVGGDPSNLSR